MDTTLTPDAATAGQPYEWRYQATDGKIRRTRCATIEVTARAPSDDRHTVIDGGDVPLLAPAFLCEAPGFLSAERKCIGIVVDGRLIQVMPHKWQPREWTEAAVST